LTLVGLLGAAALASAQFTSFNDRRRSMLEGNWQVVSARAANIPSVSMMGAGLAISAVRAAPRAVS
jgi:hypothetical protein